MPVYRDRSSPRPHVHVLTPGDHYSPSTGSAIPTVVHGLASGAPGAGPATRVAVARDTYPDRYASAEVIEYDSHPARRLDRYIDGGSSRLGRGRPGAARRFGAALRDQNAWPESIIFAHNAPVLIPLVDQRHRAVLYAHNDLFRTYSTREARRTLERADTIICVSEFLAERTRAGIDPASASLVRVVHSGVDTDLFRPRPRQQGGDELHVVFVGRMIPHKGAQILLDALAALNRSDLHVTIVGSHGFDPNAPPSRFEMSLRAQADALAAPSTVLPFQHRSRIAEILGRADIAVVPSIWPEPAGLTVLEGMASGAAVIASRVGGIPELAGAAGTLVPPGDVHALAEALEGFASDRTALSQAQAACRAHAEAHTWARAHDDLMGALR